MSPSRRRLVTIGVLTGTGLAAMEATVVGAAMPTVIASLGGLQHYSWVFSAYLLTSTVTVPVWGKLSDLYGRRPLYQIGIAFFMLGSGLSGLSTTMGQLIVFRALQGIGAGALIPLGMTILGDLYAVRERARVQGLFSGVWGVASVLGPPLGGLITESRFGWRWVFYLNVPFGLVAAAIMGFALKETRRHERPIIDFLGAGLLMAAMTLVLLGLADAKAAADLEAPWRLIAFLAAVAAGVAFVRVERRVPEPIVPPALLANRVVAVSVGAGFLTGAAMFGAISFVPLYAQAVFRTGAAGAGASLTPLMLAWVTFSVVGGRLLLHIGYRPTVLAGQVILTAGFVLLALLSTPSRVWLYTDLAVIGSGLGLTMLTLLIAVQQAVPRAQLGVATSINQLSRSLGGAIGVAVMGVVLTAGLHARAPGLQDLTRADVPDAVAASLRTVFALSALTAGLALVVAALWMPGGGPAPPKEACTSEAGERMVAAELTTLGADGEPAAFGVPE
jgi:EmrB/QacA subfamily drug resistance transporter